MPDEIQMVRCPMCDRKWIFGDQDLVCVGCKPMLDVDLAVADLERCVDGLEHCDPIHIARRRGMLTNLNHRLAELIQKAK